MDSKLCVSLTKKACTARAYLGWRGMKHKRVNITTPPSEWDANPPQHSLTQPLAVQLYVAIKHTMMIWVNIHNVRNIFLSKRIG